MFEDPIVTEVRAARERLLQEAGGDLKRLMNRIRETESQHPERLIGSAELDAMKRRSASEGVSTSNSSP